MKISRNQIHKPMARVRKLAYCGVAVFLTLVLVSPGSLHAASANSGQPNSESFDTVAAKALEARTAGQTDDAIENYQAAVKMRPGWEEGWWYLGTLLYDSDRFAEAIPALRRVVELDPKSGAAWAFLGLCEFETGNYSDAVVHLQSANQMGLAENPEIEKPAVYHLALLLNLRGEFERTTDLLAQSFGSEPLPEQIKTLLGLSMLRVPLLPAKVDPSKDAVIHAAGETEAALVGRHFDSAWRGFEQMLHDYPETPYVHYQYGVALAAASQDDRAEAQLLAATVADPQDGLPWTALANLRIRHKNFAEALAAAKRATQLSPHSSAAYQALAQALQSQGQAEQATVPLQRAAELAKQPEEISSAQIKRYAQKGFTDVAEETPAKNAAADNEPESGTTNSMEDTARRADSARRSGQLEEATVLYQRALQVHPNWQEGWRQLGTTEYMRSRYTQAISALQQSIALDAKQPDTWTLLGLSEFQIKDYKNARIHLERGRALGFSGNAAAVRFSRYHLALLRNLGSEFDGALDLLIPEAGPGELAEEIQFAMGIALLRIPALPDQIESTNKAVVRSAGEAAELLSRSYYDKAFQIFDRILQQNPKTPFLHYAYGDALASASKYDAAEIQLREETGLNPTSELAYVRLASIELTLHQPERSLQDSKMAASIAPESAEARYVLGRSLLEEGDIPAAIRELETARLLAPDSAKIHFNLARAYARANRATEAEHERMEFQRLKEQSSASGSPNDRSMSAVSSPPSSSQSGNAAH